MTACDCGLIDTHTHWVPAHFPAYLGARKGVAWPSMAPADSACQRHVMIDGQIYRTVPDAAWDGARRAHDMTRTGVAHQVVSPMPELLSYWLHADDALALTRFINDELAALVQAWPQHFTALGAVPLQNVDLAVRELERLVRELGLAGVELGSNIDGKPVGHPDFEPFFSAAEALGAAVFVHALRNSLIPIAATFGHNLGFFLTGSFLIEVTFNLPGMGLQLHGGHAKHRLAMRAARGQRRGSHQMGRNPAGKACMRPMIPKAAPV